MRRKLIITYYLFLSLAVFKSTNFSLYGRLGRRFKSSSKKLFQSCWKVLKLGHFLRKENVYYHLLLFFVNTVFISILKSLNLIFALKTIFSNNFQTICPFQKTKKR